MIKLFGFGPNFGITDASPFVLKVATFLKMAGIAYEAVNDFRNMQKAPKSKLPFIDDEGEIIADSYFILKHLQQKYGVDLEQNLTDEQKVLSNLLSKSLEDNFYWCIIYTRWVDEKRWPTIKQAFFGNMPFPLKVIVPKVARKGIKTAIYNHGMGRHSKDEMLTIAKDTLHSLSILLGDKIYFFGDKPSRFDAIAYAFLAQVTIAELDDEIHHIAHGYPNLVNYCQHIQQAYFS